MTKKLNLPKDSPLQKLFDTCAVTHELHLHELHDGALLIACFNCPYRYVMNDAEEKVVRAEMEGTRPTLL